MKAFVQFQKTYTVCAVLCCAVLCYNGGICRPSSPVGRSQTAPTPLQCHTLPLPSLPPALPNPPPSSPSIPPRPQRHTTQPPHHHIPRLAPALALQKPRRSAPLGIRLRSVGAQHAAAGPDVADAPHQHDAVDDVAVLAHVEKVAALL